MVEGDDVRWVARCCENRSLAESARRVRVRVRVIINGQFFSHRVSAGLFWRGVKFTQPYRQTRIFISRQAALATTALTELLTERA